MLSQRFLKEIFGEIKVNVSHQGDDNVATIVLLTEKMFESEELCAELVRLLRLRDNNPKSSALLTCSRRCSLGKGRRGSAGGQPSDPTDAAAGAEMSGRLKSQLVAACVVPRVVARLSRRANVRGEAVLDARGEA